MIYTDDEPGWSDVRANHNHIDIAYDLEKDGLLIQIDDKQL